jgi:hypothetical protein
MESFDWDALECCRCCKHSCPDRRQALQSSWSTPLSEPPASLHRRKEGRAIPQNFPPLAEEIAAQEACGKKIERSSHWAKKQDYPPLGKARDATFHAKRAEDEFGHIFGAICPAEGKGAGLVLPSCNTEAITLHLAEISLAVAPGAHALVLLDQAGWHVSKRLPFPDNITLLPLPPKSPELNPLENIWQFIPDNWLSNRVFDSYDDILDHCCRA